LFCHYHPNRETRVTCGRCGRPLCPDCVQHGATGVRCEECLQLPARARGVVTRAQILRAAAAAVVVSVAGGLLLGWLTWVNLITGLVLGFAVGSAAFLGSHRHRDAAIQGIAGGMALAGVLLAAVIASLGDAGGGLGGLARALVTISYAEFLLPALASLAGAVIRFLL
jgi:hypothetical protein